MNDMKTPAFKREKLFDPQTASMGDVAMAFLAACDGGAGREGAAHLCTADASFIAQCDQLAGINRLDEYCDWMKTLLVCMPDASYEVRSLGIDEPRHNATLFVTMTGTHSAEGGPVPPTGKTFTAEYVYALEFDGNKIRHITKIWNDPWSLRELGWS